MNIPFVISFQESFEVLLIIVPIIIYLYRINKKNMVKHIFLGTAAGTLLSLLTGFLVVNQVLNIEGNARGYFEGGLMLFLSGLILYNIAWIGKQKKAVELDIKKDQNIKITASSIFLLSFLTVFRESLEVIIFMVPLAAENPLTTYGGVAAGLVLALVVMLIIYKTSARLSISIIFSFLTLILIFIGGKFLGEGLLQLVPNVNDSIEKAGMLLYSLPLLYLFLKRELKKYIKK